MNAGGIPFGKRSIEDKLSQIGAKVANAVEMSFSAQKLCGESIALLMDAQTEIADLYESLGEILGTPTAQNDSFQHPSSAILAVDGRPRCCPPPTNRPEGDDDNGI